MAQSRAILVPVEDKEVRHNPIISNCAVAYLHVSRVTNAVKGTEGDCRRTLSRTLCAFQEALQALDWTLQQFYRPGEPTTFPQVLTERCASFDAMNLCRRCLLLVACCSDIQALWERTLSWLRAQLPPQLSRPLGGARDGARKNLDHRPFCHCRGELQGAEYCSL